MAKSKYYTHVKPRLKEISKLAEHGATNVQICNLLGISEAVLYVYQEKYIELKEAVTRVKAEANSIVESALFKRACGYDYEESDEHSQVTTTATGSKKTITRKKHIPPDTAAATMWLKNRNRKEWSDNSDLTLHKPLQVVISPDEEV